MRYAMPVLFALSVVALIHCGAEEQRRRTRGGGPLAPATCGNGSINGLEECDGADLNSLDCLDLGYTGGTLTCAGCVLNVSACTGPNPCGNGLIDLAEECDGANLAGAGCLTLGYTGGNLSCTNCDFNTSACTGPRPCPNGVLNAGEFCDGNVFDPLLDTCFAWGYDAGTLACNADCTPNLSGCTLFRCGDGQVNGLNEDCDGANLDGATCMSRGFTGGTLSCTNCAFNTDNCTAACACNTGAGCQANCACDPDCAACVSDQNLGSVVASPAADGTTQGQTDSYRPSCAATGGSDIVYRWTAPSAGSFTFDTIGSLFDTVLHVRNALCAELACDDDAGPIAQSSLTVDLTAGQVVYVVVDGFDNADFGGFVLNISPGAVQTCPNGAIDAGEDCDSGLLGNATCANIGRGFTGGVLGCNNNTCTFNTAGCNLCGNAAINVGEDCDTGLLGSATCANIGRGFTGGALACNNNSCTFNTTSCTTGAVNGAACTSGAACAGGGCISQAGSGWPGGYCTEDCSAGPCTAGGHCFVNTFCVANCTTDASCRPGYRCRDVDGDAAGVRECFAIAEGSGLPGDACTLISDCSGDIFGFCWTAADGFPGGYCSITCKPVQLPCPAGSHCGLIDPNDNFGVCLDNCAVGTDCRGSYFCADHDLDAVNECLPPPPGWTCFPLWYGANDGCDCQCGVPDPDCGGGGCSAAGCCTPNQPPTCNFCN